MNTQQLDSLITFKLGLPSLYHIMLGMAEDETQSYQEEIDNQKTDKYDLNDFIKSYDVLVERNAFSDKWRLKDLSFSIPLEQLTEKDIKMLFDYLSYRVQVIEKQFCIKNGGDNTIKEIDCTINTALYDIKITCGKNESDDNRVFISFTSENDISLDKLRCLSIILNNERCFATDLFDYISQNRT